MLLHDGFSYTCSRKNESTCYWICRRRGECKAKMTTDPDASRIIAISSSHTHAGDPTELNLLRTRHRIKEKAVGSRETPHQILLDAASAVSDDTASQMPAPSSLRRVIRKQRQRATFSYSIPSTRGDIRVPVEFKVTSKGESFLLHDSGDGDSARILIFATEKNLHHLAQSTVLLVDGTFKVTPPLFYQLYTVHAVLHGVVMPMAYGLLPSKSEDTYRRFFAALLNAMGRHSIEVVYSDFEIAAMNAVQDLIPSARIQGCFFHLSQSVYRRVCASGLQSTYNTQEDFAVLMRMFPSLAFLPTAEIPEAFQDLLEVIPVEAVPVANYFEDTYVGRPRRNGLCSALFPPEVWSVRESTLEDMPRTNNSVEAWHRGFQRNVGCTAPNLWFFLDCLKKEQSLTEMKIAQAQGGTTLTRVSKKHADCNKRIRFIVENYSSTRRMECLRALARNLAF